jgi:hypothetical protein
VSRLKNRQTAALLQWRCNPPLDPQLPCLARPARSAPAIERPSWLNIVDLTESAVICCAASRLIKVVNSAFYRNPETGEPERKFPLALAHKVGGDIVARLLTCRAHAF